MKYLKIKIAITLLFIANNITAQDTDVPSKLKDFEGIWQFIPPQDRQNEFDFIAFDFIHNSKRLKLYFRKKSVTVHTLGPDIIGFIPSNKEISRLSELENVGQRMWFYEPNPKAPNDSVKYYRQASPSCFASFNGLGTDNFDPPAKGEPNYFLFNFDGREYEYHRQIKHIPNEILTALCKNKIEKEKVETFLGIKFNIINLGKTIIYTEPTKPTKMYLLKGDVITVLQEKDNWVYILYVTSKNKEIKGWVKKEDVSSK